MSARNTFLAGLFVASLMLFLGLTGSPLMSDDSATQTLLILLSMAIVYVLVFKGLVGAWKNERPIFWYILFFWPVAIYLALKYESLDAEFEKLNAEKNAIPNKTRNEMDSSVEPRIR